MTQAPLSRTGLMLGAALCAAPTMSLSVTYNFGLDNDGLAGFTQSTTDSTETWSTQNDSVRYINDDVGTVDDGNSGPTRNASLLRSIVLDRSVGKMYKVQGLVTLTDGYADDNNRVGIYLFGDYADIPGQVPPAGNGDTDEEQGALYLRYNTDKGLVDINEGLDGPLQANANKTGGYLAEDNSIFDGTDLLFTAMISFVDDGGSEMIDIQYVLTDALGDETTVNTSVVAADYTGDFFGFATRARNRGVTSSDRDAPFTMDYRSFSVAEVPEPTAVVAGLAFGGLCLMRRRYG